MEKYNVQQFVYANVEEEDSPWGERGFQTLFYPVDLMDKRKRMDVENRIHFPVLEGVETKDTVFFISLNGEPFLSIFHFTSLPEEVDSFGRGGKFISHGFLFPPSLWKRVPAPFDLFSLVRHYLFTTTKDALNSPMVNRQNGNIAPISLCEDDIQNLERVPVLQDEFHRQMALVLNDFAKRGEKAVPVLVRGRPDGVSALLNSVLPWVPSPHRPEIGWDPCYEKGNFSFFPLNIVGFREGRPTTAESVLIDLSTGEITGWKGKPETPFEKWIASSPSDEVTPVQIDACGAFSDLLMGSIQPPISPEYQDIPSGFVKANAEEVERAFEEEMASRTGSIASIMARTLSNMEKAELLAKGFPEDILVERTMKAVLKSSMRPGGKDLSSLSALAKAGPAMFQIMARVWNGDSPVYLDLKDLSPEERFTIVRYWVLTEDETAGWLSDILRSDRKIAERLYREEETRIRIEKCLLSLISLNRDALGIEQCILDFYSYEGRALDILDGIEDVSGIVERYLETVRWDDKSFNALLSWKHRNPMTAALRMPLFLKPAQSERHLPFTRSFLEPESGVDPAILKSPDHRPVLLDTLIKFHGFEFDRLEELGFDHVEIAGAVERTGKYVPGLLYALLTREEYDLFLSILSQVRDLGREKSLIASFFKQAGPDVRPDVVREFERRFPEKGEKVKAILNKIRFNLFKKGEQ